MGFCRGHALSDKVFAIGGLWVDDKERGKKLGYHLLRVVIEKSKASRLYMLCHPNLEEYYLKFGFETLKEPPAEMKELHKKIVEVTGDKTVPLFLAYQKKKKDLSFTSVPDLIVIDGGKGQLHAAHDVLFSKGLNIPMISLEKRGGSFCSR